MQQSNKLRIGQPVPKKSPTKNCSYHGDRENICTWIQQEINKGYFFQNSALMEKIFKANSTKSMMLQVKKGGGKSFLIDYIQHICDRMIDKVHYQQINKNIVKNLQKKMVLKIQLSKAKIVTFNRDAGDFHMYFRQDLLKAFAQFKNLYYSHLNEEEVDEFDELLDLKLDIGEYFSKLLDFFFPLNSKNSYNNILVLIDDIDILFSVKECYFSKKSQNELQTEIDKIFVTLHNKGIRTIGACTQNTMHKDIVRHWNAIYDQDPDSIYLFQQSWNEISKNCNIDGDSLRTQKIKKIFEEQIDQKEYDRTIIKFSVQIAKALQNINHTPKVQSQVRLLDCEKMYLYYKFSGFKNQGMPLLEALINNEFINKEDQTNSKSLLNILRNFGLISSFDRQKYKINQAQKEELKKIKLFLEQIYIPEVDMIEYMDLCKQLVLSCANEELFMETLSKILLRKVGQWRQKTMKEADVEVLVSGIFSIFAGAKIIKCQQLNKHNKRLDAIILPKSWCSETPLILIMEYKVKKAEKYREKEAVSAIQQIIAKNYMEVGLNECYQKQIFNGIFILRGLVININNHDQIEAYSKQVKLDQFTASYLSFLTCGRLNSLKGQQNVSDSEIMKPILETLIPGVKQDLQNNQDEQLNLLINALQDVTGGKYNLFKKQIDDFYQEIAQL